MFINYYSIIYTNLVLYIIKSPHLNAYFNSILNHPIVFIIFNYFLKGHLLKLLNFISANSDDHFC